MNISKIDSKVQTAVDKACSEVEALNDQIKSIQEKIKKEVQANLKPQLQDIFNSFEGRLKSISVIGYTPGFNDGDPCYHSQYTEEECEGAEDITNEEWCLLDRYFNSLQYGFEQVYGTDWRLTFSANENGEVEIGHDHYDCGY